ncbi:MAG: hypothetical protein JWN38_1068 [Candidatus Saccharibacteria bacterium]|nr:hypothetical protein [Candidatus Saccharibacteria bacterium]
MPTDNGESKKTYPSDTSFFMPEQRNPPELGAPLFTLFSQLFRANGLVTGQCPREDELELEASGHRPSVLLQSCYRGLGQTALEKRRVRLEYYQSAYRHLQTLPMGTVKREYIRKRTKQEEIDDSVPFVMRLIEPPERTAHKWVMVDDILETIPDHSGVMGVESFGLYIRPHRLAARRPPHSTTPRSLIVSHTYFLDEESKRYDLPQSTGGERAHNLYPYRQEPEPTWTFIDGRREDCAAQLPEICETMRWLLGPQATQVWPPWPEPAAHTL